MSQVIEQIRVNGIGMSAVMKDQVTDGQLKLSTGSVAAFDCTIQDTHDLTLTREAGKVFGEGAVILWDDFTLTLTEFTTGGNRVGPTIDVSATSSFVDSLKEQTGGQDWGTTEVSTWAKNTITAVAAKHLVQPNLGERQIERKEPEGDHSDPETTWDVLAEMAKQTGAWLFEYGNTVILAKPSWLVAQYGTRRYNVQWNSWTDHTDALTSAPAYSWSKEAKEWEGKQTLTIKAIDPGPGSTNPLSQCRPGDIIHYTGTGAITDDPLWIVRDVTHPLYIGAPVTIVCWRPIDPPEIIPGDDKAQDGGASAGVPSGPLGKYGWNGEQLVNASEIVKEAQRKGLPTLAAELAVATAMGESSLINKGYGDAAGPDSVGLFQQRDTWGSRSDRLQPARAAGFFLDALTKQPYETNYRNGADSLAASNIGVRYIGPGSTPNAASVTIHRVQINADPYHYAKFWDDAKLVVKECKAAGEDAKDSGGGGKATGPLGTRIDQLMRSYEMRSIDVDGAFGAQCVDLTAKYITDLYGIATVRGNGVDYWRHPGLLGKFTPIDVGRAPRKGDLASWSGSHGDYTNGGYGHVAIYSHTNKGVDFYLSQNPGPSRTQPLTRSGLQGWMRPKAT